MSTPFKSEWLQPGAVIPVDIPTLAAFAEELRRVNQENQTLRQALEPEQEPVAWRPIETAPKNRTFLACRRHSTMPTMAKWNAEYGWFEDLNMDHLYDLTHWMPLPPAPSTAPRLWQGLTDEEIKSVCYNRDWTAPWTNTTFARAIETKLREKNHG